MVHTINSNTSYLIELIIETNDKKRNTISKYFYHTGENADFFPKEKGLLDKVILDYELVLDELKNGKTNYQNKLVESVILRTVVEGFDDSGYENKTDELRDKLKNKIANNEPFEIDENSKDAFERFVNGYFEGFLIEEEITKLDGKTKVWYSFEYNLDDSGDHMDVPAPRRTINILDEITNSKTTNLDEFGIEYDDNELFLKFKLDKKTGYYKVAKCNPKAKNIKIPETYEGIPVGIVGKIAFKGCKKLKNVVIPSTVFSIEKEVFYNCLALENVILPEGIQEIADHLFYHCENLENIILPESIKEISWNAFAYCESLKEIIIPNNVKTIGSDAFAECKNLSKVTLPESLKEISDSAFEGCISLTYINLPKNLKQIGRRAINCALTSIFIPNKVQSIGNSKLYSLETGPICGYYSNLTEIVVEKGNKNFDSRDNCNAIIRTADNLLIQGCNTTIIPEGISEIGDNAFYNCKDLTSINIPNGVTSIGNYAFYSCCNLTNVTLPNTVRNIGSSAFSGCKKITSINIPDGIAELKHSTFYSCSSLTNVIIPNSINKIDVSVFKQCNNLLDIYYLGTQIQWNSIDINPYNQGLASKTIHFYSKTEPNEAGNYWHFDADGVTPIKW